MSCMHVEQHDRADDGGKQRAEKYRVPGCQ